MKTGQRFALWGACCIAFTILAAQFHNRALAIISYIFIGGYLIAAIFLWDIRRIIIKGNILELTQAEKDLSILSKEYTRLNDLLTGYAQETGEQTPTLAVFTFLKEEFAELNKLSTAWDAHDVVIAFHHELFLAKIHLDRAVQFYSVTKIPQLKLRYSVLREEAEELITQDFSEHLDDIESDYKNACIHLLTREDEVIGCYMFTCIITRLENLIAALSKSNQH